jgi:hypothetical protein
MRLRLRLCLDWIPPVVCGPRVGAPKEHPVQLIVLFKSFLGSESGVQTQFVMGRSINQHAHSRVCPTRSTVVVTSDRSTDQGDVWASKNSSFFLLLAPAARSANANLIAATITMVVHGLAL